MLDAYRYQPNLERRHHRLKSVHDAAPILLHSPTRIKALLRCQFLALLIAALIDRNVRNNMTSAALDTISLLGRPPSAYTQPTKSTKQAR